MSIYDYCDATEALAPFRDKLAAQGIEVQRQSIDTAQHPADAKSQRSPVVPDVFVQVLLVLEHCPKRAWTLVEVFKKDMFSMF